MKKLKSIAFVMLGLAVALPGQTWAHRTREGFKMATTETIETHCKCGRVLVKKPRMFFLRETGFMPGMFCEACKAIFPSEEWNEAVRARFGFFSRLAREENSEEANEKTD